MRAEPAEPRNPHTPAAGRRQPVTSYRLQLTPDFPFSAVKRIVPYLSQLGVTDVFFSPILQAAPGSTHGYDVVDHSAISADLGGMNGFVEASKAIHDAGMHLIVDVVPNHMAVPTPLYHNRALWSVLKDGSDSPYAQWFDIELNDSGDGLLMPVLGERIGTALAAGSITVEDMQIPGEEKPTKVVKYFDHVFPVRTGTEALPLAELLNAQYYRLAYWRVADEELNYRRFFDVDTLAAIRVERPEVFAASHKLLIKLLDRGYIDALRIDHPDGLADPRGYFRNLDEATGGAWTVAEKILEGEEALPTDWPCAGTTGYDALMRLQGLFTDPAGIASLTQAYTEISQSTDSVPTVEVEAKRQIVRTSLFAEVDRLANILAEVCHADVRLRDHTFRSIREVLDELIVHMDRYRAYIVPGEQAHPDEERVIRKAAERAARNLDPDRQETLDVVVDILLGKEIGSAGRTYEARRGEAIVRFQQVAGAVMAKGVEDTTYYRYTALTSANEVGVGPSFMTSTPDAFHDFQARMAQSWPVTMTTLSTHDTKRCEDVRAHIAPISQFADQWLELLTNCRDLTAEQRPATLDGQIENLLWQTLIGTWTPDGPINFERLSAYLLKAAREQKSWTTWTEQATAEEQGLLDYAKFLLENDDVRAAFAEFFERIRPAARTQILSQKAIQMTMVGVPDIYNGEEITQTSLVDPDNRRPVDYPALQDLLTELEQGLPANPDLDTEKLWITSRLARLRRNRPEIVHAGYQPLPVSTGHALAFARTLDGEPEIATVAIHHLAATNASSTVVLPEGTWHNVLTGKEVAGGSQDLAEVLGRFPVAVLEREVEQA